MISPTTIICLALLLLAAAAVPQALVRGGSLRSKTAAVAQHHRLRLCNAFASANGLEMRRMQEPKLVEYPLPFKACHDYNLPLHLGDQLLFRAAGEDLGTFAVQSLPSPGSLLLLVPYRKVASSEKALAFQSHVFTKSNFSQIALIDAFTDTAAPPDTRNTVTVAETRQRKEGVWRPDAKKEELNLNSVASLTPGYYQLALGSGRESLASKADEYLNANGQEAYVAMRVGAGTSFPQEFVVFPHLSLADLETAVESKAVRHFSGSLSLWTALFAVTSGFLGCREASL